MTEKRYVIVKKDKGKFVWKFFCIFAVCYFMIDYRKYILSNGLTLLTHEAWDTPLATVNVMYNVGARDEDPQRTGFAHLFEHLMFGGTERVPDFDAVVSSLGGESNAFTNNDITNYYITLPVAGLPTALMLEADRMGGLSLTPKALEVQQKVVTEEYNQRYMNQPYGDVWLLLRPLCYKKYPYRWATIGADIRHVSEATLEDVKAFHERYYRADNAILAVAAPMKHEEMVAMVEREWRVESEEWRTESGERREERCFARERMYPVEEEQREARRQEVRREVPADAVYLAWPMCDHFGEDFRACDLLSDLLGTGHSSRIYNNIVREGRLVTEADAYITGDAGPGLLVLSAKVKAGVDPDEVAEALRREAYKLTEERVDDYELEKVKNRYESTFVYSQYKAADRALALCQYTWLGDTERANRDAEDYRRVTAEQMQQAARHLFCPERENVLIVRKGGE